MPAQRYRKSLAILGLAAGAAVSASVSHAANPSCAWYIAQAIRQHQDNMQRACGLRGSEWSPETRVHALYCENHAPEEARALIATRQKQLDACAPASSKTKS